MARFVCVLLGVLALGFAGCGRVNVEEERSRLMETDRQFARSAKDVDLFMSYWTPDATAYPSGGPALHGSDAVRKGFAEPIAAQGVSLSWTPERAEVSAAGDLGYTVGTYEMTMDGATDSGKYITIWRKQPEGTWKVIEDIGNSNLPPPGAPPARESGTTP